MRLRLIFALLLMLTPAPLAAVQVDEILPNAALELRARQLSSQLRCLVCQNQSIDDSDAPLAHDLRVLVRERLVAGDSDEAVKAYLVARYGEFILLEPPFSPKTYLLWFFPILCLGLATIFILRSRTKAKAQPTEPVTISPEEQARLKEILGDRDPA